MRQYVFLDECGVATDLLRRYGRSPSGTRLRDHTPCSHWETTRSSPRCGWRGSGRRPSSTARSSTRPSWPTWSKSWCPRSVQGAVHEQPEVHTAIAAAGARLRFLPPSSPDFNPIELAFAKLKAFLRAARPRTFDRVCALMAAALELFTPAECRNFVEHCGYRVATDL